MRQLLLDLFAGAAASPPADPCRDSGSNRPAALDGQAQTAIDNVATIALTQALAPARFAHPQANRQIVLGDAQVAYAFRRGKRRTIGFAVGADGLTVSAPRWTPLAEVDAALREKARWIVAKLDEARARHERLESARIDWRDGARVPFLGQPVVLRLDPRQRHGRGGAALESVVDPGAGEARHALHLGLPHSATPEQLRDSAQAWLMRQARRVFTARLDHFAPRLDVRWQRLTLSSAGTRWGSASADGSIRLNWRLIHLSEPVIDYVVVHELAHLREMNHSARFWQHVQAVLPDYAERRGALRELALPRW